LSSVFALAALGLAYANSTHCAIVLCAVAVFVIVVMRNLGSSSASHLPELRRRNRLLRTAVRTSSQQLRVARDAPAIWNALKPFAEVLGASRFALDLGCVGVPASAGVTFEITRSTNDTSPLDVSVEAVVAGVKVCRLCMSWRDGRGEVDRDDELALQTLAHVVGKATVRVTSGPRPSVLPS
jgi:UDP-GlcNAc:undecaprenyl-phosphate GlcNAc-1-phosphate transferase